MKKLKGLTALLLVLVMMFAAAACDNSKSTDSTDESNTLEDISGVVDGTGENDSAAFALVAHATLRNGETMTEALNYLKDAIKAAYGIDAVIKGDSGFNLAKAKQCIIIGDTIYTEYNAIADGMKIDDYAYKIESEQVVVINGGSFDAIFEGVKRFCTDVLNYTDGKSNGAAKAWSTDIEYKHSGEYSDKAVAINGIAIEEFKIAVSNKNDISAAERLVAELGKHNGYSVPVVTYDKLEGDEKGVVCFGKLDREGKKNLRAVYGGYRIVAMDKNNYTLAVAGSDPTNYEKAVTKLFKNIKTTTSGSTVNISLPTENIQEYTYSYVRSESFKLTRNDSKTKTENVSDGVVYKQYHYTNKNGSPYVVDVLYVDTSKNSFRLGTPRETTDKTYTAPQVLTGQMKAAADAGYDVVAATNGDRWDTHSSPWYIYPRGLTIKDGKLITRGVMSLPFFALTKGGEYYIGTDGMTANTTDISMAVGGDYMLVSNGLPVAVKDMNDQHCYGSHPRTLIGITDDGDLIMVVVDGRQPSYSNGLTMEMAADLMASLGACNAVSLDGGGSSTMAVKSGSSYVVKNQPCNTDHEMRSLVNSILIYKKK